MITAYDHQFSKAQSSRRNLPGNRGRAPGRLRKIRSRVHSNRVGASDRRMMIATSGWEMLSHLINLGVAYVLAFPIGWNRERQERSAGIRTFPLVEMAALRLRAGGNPHLGGRFNRPGAYPGRIDHRCWVHRRRRDTKAPDASLGHSNSGKSTGNGRAGGRSWLRLVRHRRYSRRRHVYGSAVRAIEEIAGKRRLKVLECAHQYCPTCALSPRNPSDQIWNKAGSLTLMT